MMDQTQYFNWAKTVEGGSKSPEEAVCQWQGWIGTSDPSVIKDHKGKNGGLRVAVHVEDIVYGYNEVETGQQFDKEHTNNRPTLDDMAEMQDEAVRGTHGVHGFGSSVYAGVGGSMGMGLATGGRSVVNADGSMGSMPIASALGSQGSDMQSLLQDFGYVPKVKGSRKGCGRGRNLGNVQEEPSLAVLSGSGGAVSERGEAVAGLGGGSVPPTPRIEASPFVKKKDVPALRLRAVEMLQQKLTAAQAEAKQQLELATSKVAEHNAMSAAEQVPISAWVSIMQARMELLNMLLTTDNEEGVGIFWAECDETKLSYLNTNKESLRCCYQLAKSIKGFDHIIDADVLEETRARLFDDVNLFAEMVKSLKRSVNDYLVSVRSQARSVLRREKEEMRHQEIKAKGRGTGSKAQRGSGGRPPNAGGPAIFSCAFPETSRIIVFENTEDFAKAREDGSVNADFPYIVKNVPLNDLGDITMKQQSYFMRDFPNSAVFKGDNPSYRGQSFMKHSDPQLATKFEQYTPPNAAVDIKCDAADVEKHLGTPAFFGRGPKVQSCGADFMGLGALKIITEGMLKVVTMDLSELSKLGACVDGSPTESVDEMKTTMESFTVEKLQEFFVAGTTIRAGIVAAGCVLYVPPACLLGERALRNGFVFGLRKSALVRSPAMAASYQIFHDMQSPCNTKSAALKILSPVALGGTDTPVDAQEDLQEVAA